jgi:hypothetical protein
VRSSDEARRLAATHAGCVRQRRARRPRLAPPTPRHARRAGSRSTAGADSRFSCCSAVPHRTARPPPRGCQPDAATRAAPPCRDGTSTAGASRSTAARSSSFVSRTHPILPPLLLSATRAQPAKRSLLLPWRCVCSCPSRSLLCRIGRLTSAATRARHRASRAPLSRVSKSARACACPLLSRRAPLSPSYLSTSILALPAATLPPLRAALSALLLRQQQRRTGASWRRPSPPPQRSCPA